MKISVKENNKPQINAPIRASGGRIHVNRCASWRRPHVSMHSGVHDADERRFIVIVYPENESIQSPQRTQRTQSIATIIFATFALFAVRFVRHLTMPLGTTVEALGGK